jgi:hypothetical protein
VHVTRRRFLACAGSAAAGTLTSRAVQAQTHQRPQRVAVIGVGHYHAFSPPNYLRILQTEKTDIVGVHDPDARRSPTTVRSSRRRRPNSSSRSDITRRCRRRSAISSTPACRS